MSEAYRRAGSSKSPAPPERGLLVAVMAGLVAVGLIVGIGVYQGFGVSVLVAVASTLTGVILSGVTLFAQRTEEKSVRVFLSYNHDNDAAAQDLARQLNHLSGIAVNTQGSLALGADLRQALRQELASSDVLLVLLSPQEAPTDWVSWELDTARDLGLPIVPVRINVSGAAARTSWEEIGDPLTGRVGVDVEDGPDGYARAAERIALALRTGKLAAP